MVDEHVAIQVLSDDVLLHIFLFLRPHWNHIYFGFSPTPTPTLTWEWHRLAHVCRRWRYLIFATPHHLGLGLVTSCYRRGITTLGLWPPLPICIHYNSHCMPSLKVEQDVIATLEHCDRILEIKLTISDSMLEKSNVWMESFPALEYLCLNSPEKRCQPESTVLPSGFLGGSTLRLRYIVLERISIPTLPQLLLSSRGLIHLSLGEDVLEGDGFLSPAVLSAALSTASLLESLHVHFPSDIFDEEQESTDSELPPPNLVVLPALTYFKSKGQGSNEYLEDFVSRIHAPRLEKICVGFSYEDARPLDIPQLSQFISRTERMSALPIQTSISLEENNFRISHDFKIRGRICFELTCESGFQQVSQVDHIGGICRQLTPLISDVERVSIEVTVGSQNSPDERDMIMFPQWLRLFRLFDGAQELELDIRFQQYLALETAKIGQEVLPALRILRLDIGLTPQVIKSFVAERELTGRPITVLCHSCYGHIC